MVLAVWIVEGVTQRFLYAFCKGCKPSTMDGFMQTFQNKPLDFRHAYMHRTNESVIWNNVQFQLIGLFVHRVCTLFNETQGHIAGL